MVELQVSLGYVKMHIWQQLHQLSLCIAYLKSEAC